MADDSLVARMTTMANRLARLPNSFGLPQYRSVVLVPFEGAAVPIVPSPKVEQVGLLMGKRRVGDYLTSTVQITGTELQVTVSRVYDKEVLRLYDWLVDAVETTEGWQGKVYTCETLDETTSAVDYLCYLVPRNVV